MNMKIQKNIAILGFPNAGKKTFLDFISNEKLLTACSEEDYTFKFSDISVLLEILNLFKDYDGDEVRQRFLKCIHDFLDSVDCIIWIINSQDIFVDTLSIKALSQFFNPKKLIIVFNKCDKENCIPSGFESRYFDLLFESTYVFTSFENGKNTDCLLTLIIKKIFPYIHQRAKFLC